MEAARICTDGMRQTSSKKLSLELGWEPLFKRRKWHKLIYMFKIVHVLSPLYLSQICQPTASSTRYATRSANNIRVLRCRTSYFNFFFPPSIGYWNSLDYTKTYLVFYCIFIVLYCIVLFVLYIYVMYMWRTPHLVLNALFGQSN